ncbi:MAG TPA: hypothetical protein VD994_03840, partial [Prosthecobacter sp.]|nr:hypothetical protein [Prosthecobacter sp.]
SKRVAGLRNVVKAIDDAVGTRSRLVLIDSASGKPRAIEKADMLLDLPQTEATDTAADIPALMQAALDYITANKTGRTDVWLLSDLQETDWDPGSGRWQPLRRAFATLQGVRFHVLSYPEVATDDLAVKVDRVTRREASENAELLLDLEVVRSTGKTDAAEVPIRFVINGVSTTQNVAMKGNRMVLQAHVLPIDKGTKRGWGRIELPTDASPANNVYYFAFDEPPILRSVIVSDAESEAEPLRAALSAPADPMRQYAVEILSSRRAAEIAWGETALIVWHAPLPRPDDALALQLRSHVAAGHAILFLPPDVPDATQIFGLGWDRWQTAANDKPQSVEWWRNDADLLANTRDGASLPVGTLEIARRCGITGEGTPLARMADRNPLLMRSAIEGGGGAYFLGTLPGADSSSLARDGVVMFAMLHRVLNEGGRNLGKAQQRHAGSGALGSDASDWKAAGQLQGFVASENLPLRAGVVSSDTHFVALNRPPGEDRPQPVAALVLSELFAGLDFRVLTEDLHDSRSLTNEVWRTFLMAMAAALLGEALLCLPQRRQISVARAPKFEDRRVESAA